MVETSHAALTQQSRGRVSVKHGTVKGIDTTKKHVLLSDGSFVPYDRLGLCSGACLLFPSSLLLPSLSQRFSAHVLWVWVGARPRVLSESPHVLGIRDTESVAELASRLATARRVMVVGNGGQWVRSCPALIKLGRFLNCGLKKKRQALRWSSCTVCM